MTAIVTTMALAAGVHGRSAALAAAVLCGQFSVGWSNDAIDAPLDLKAGRTDKPLATGAIKRTTVARCALAALLIDIPLSLALGVEAGLLHLAAVALAWSYNLGLKRTVLSPLPYALAFALVPEVVTAMLPGSPQPQGALVLAGAMCGVAAHFANTVGDVAEDELTGVRGLPQRLGPARSTVIAGGCVALAALGILAAAGASVLTVATTVVAVAIALALPVVVRRPGPRQIAFRLVIVAVGLLVVTFVIGGGSHLVAT